MAYQSGASAAEDLRKERGGPTGPTEGEVVARHGWAII